MNTNERTLLAVALTGVGMGIGVRTVWFMVLVLVIALIVFVLITIEAGGKKPNLSRKTLQVLAGAGVFFVPPSLATVFNAISGQGTHVTFVEQVLAIILVALGIYYGLPALREQQYVEAVTQDVSALLKTAHPDVGPNAKNAPVTPVVIDGETTDGEVVADSEAPQADATQDPAADDSPVEDTPDQPGNYDDIPVQNGTIQVGNPQED